MEDSQDELPRVLWSCTISSHMRSLGKVLGAFDKIGRDLFIEAAADRLLLRTLNQAQSAFCLCTLPICLFDHFEVAEDPPTVKIWLKLLSPLFRSQSVQSTTLQLMHHGPSSYVRVVLRTTSGLLKTFDLCYEEVMPVNAMYDTESCPHRISAEPRMLLDCVNNLPAGEHEMTLCVSQTELVVKNDVDDNLADSAVRTEMSIAPADLHEFAIGPLGARPLRVAFATKEFKAMLTFAEGCSAPISLHFDYGGRPIILVADAGDGPPGERARLECVIATVVDQAAAADDFFDDDGYGGAQPMALGSEQPAASMPYSAPPPLPPPPPQRAQPQAAANDAAAAPWRPHAAADSQPLGRVPPPPPTSASQQPSLFEYDRAPHSLPGPSPPPPPHGAVLPARLSGADPISSFPSTRQPTPAAPFGGARATDAYAAVCAAMGSAEAAPHDYAPSEPTPGARPSATGGAPFDASAAAALGGEQRRPADSDTDNDDDAVGATPPGSPGTPPSKRACAGFVEQFALPTGLGVGHRAGT